LLEAVVDTGGTASNLQTKQYKIAGKTGTSQLNYSKLNTDKKFGHRSSFVGYFPADNPMYSIVVVISEPRQNGYFGAYVAGPVFRKISDRIFSRMYDQHFAYNETDSDNKLPMNYATAGIQADYSILFKELNIPFNYESRGEWSKIKKSDNKFTLIEKEMPNGKIPNVVGMGARDASYLLENLGVKVQLLGCGRVRKQSMSPGALVRSNQTIRLFLG
jgi:cell division protein FtsI (penicillin-binding protein 3)